MSENIPELARKANFHVSRWYLRRFHLTKKTFDLNIIIQKFQTCQREHNWACAEWVKSL